MKTLVLAFLCLLAPAWGSHGREPTYQDRDRMDRLMLLCRMHECPNRLEYFQELFRDLPRDYLIGQIITRFNEIDSRDPWTIEHLRQCFIELPDWDEFLAEKMKVWREVIEMKPLTAPRPNYGRLLHGALEWVGFIATRESVAILGSFLDFTLNDYPLHALHGMKIPGAPATTDLGAWQQWWKENEALYRAGKGAEPTHRHRPKEFIGPEHPILTALPKHRRRMFCGNDPHRDAPDLFAALWMHAAFIPAIRGAIDLEWIE
jgi:hypothetical protein